jgi:hypothetical protein
MNSFGRKSLSVLRSAYRRLFLRRDNPIRFDFTGQEASDLIRQSLTSDLPCMICRFGSVELDAVLRYVDINAPHSLARKSLMYILGQIGPFWWDDRIKHKMQKNTGFFPATGDALNQFSQRMINDIKQIDILASWQRQEIRLRNHFPEANIMSIGRINALSPKTHAHRAIVATVFHPDHTGILPESTSLV